jgi:hypothetical protein
MAFVSFASGAKRCRFITAIRRRLTRS